MSFRPSLALFSKASRMPLISKQANKEFYKGTGSFPGLGPKRQGRHPARSKAPYILMKERMRTFVVPEIQLDDKNQTLLKPYVSREVNIQKYLGPGAEPDPAHWPIANSKTGDSKRAGLFGPKGLDGEYYIQLAEHFAGMRDRGENPIGLK